MNENLLLKSNSGKSYTQICLNKGCITYKSDVVIFDGTTIRDILFFVNTLHLKYKGVNMPISFEFGNITFQDKLTYVFFEVICFVLIKEFNHSVYVKFQTELQIFTEGVESSPLLLLKTGEKEHIQKFVAKYNFDIFNNHYRRVISQEDMEDEKLCKIMDEIRCFLNFFSVMETCLDDITEVIIELIGNVSEHTDSDCLVDIDVTTPYYKKNEDGLESGLFYGINLTVIDFSHNLFNEQIKERILYKNVSDSERYQKVQKAYEFHQKSFGDAYREEDFFNITAFQHKISGNKSKHITGGTGLTKLICSLEKQSDTHNCYLISGDRALWFFHELLEYNDENWIGFNQEKDFLTHLPEANAVGDDSIFMPGTAYNLNFVMKGKEGK